MTAAGSKLLADTYIETIRRMVCDQTSELQRIVATKAIDPRRKSALLAEIDYLIRRQDAHEEKHGIDFGLLQNNGALQAKRAHEARYGVTLPPLKTHARLVHGEVERAREHLSSLRGKILRSDHDGVTQ